MCSRVHARATVTYRSVCTLLNKYEILAYSYWTFFRYANLLFLKYLPWSCAHLDSIRLKNRNIRVLLRSSAQRKIKREIHFALHIGVSVRQSAGPSVGFIFPLLLDNVSVILHRSSVNNNTIFSFTGLPLSTYLPLCLSFCLSVCLSVFLSVDLNVFLLVSPF